MWEWNETVVYGSYRGLRGGSSGDGPGSQPASIRWSFSPIVSIRAFPHRLPPSPWFPEPATLLLLALGGMAVMRRRY